MDELKGTWTCKYNDAVVIPRYQAEGCILCQMNYIVAQLNIHEWNPNHSTGDVDQMSGLADDYLSLDNRLAWKECETSVSQALMGIGLGTP